MDSLFLAGVVLGSQHLLDPVPSLDRHQRLMPSGIPSPAVADEALVVGMLEQADEVGDDQGLRGLARPRHASQARFGDLG